MGARSFVAQRPFDQNNVWRIAEVRDEAGGGDAYQKAAAGSEKLLSHQHRIVAPTAQPITPATPPFARSNSNSSLW